MAMQKEWVTPNRMRFESLHRTFNRQVDCISIGNVIGHVQLSGYIRPRNETECNHFTFEKGHLQEYDLNWLLKDFPYYVKEFVRTLDYAESHTTIGYEFRLWRGAQKTVIGYVVTAGADAGHKLLKQWVVGRDWRAGSVVSEAIKHITD